jgi:antitoxin component of RelBE/YafQ-DinJ toxin-antitoxin module
MSQNEETVWLIQEMDQARDDIKWHQDETRKCLELINNNRQRLVEMYGEDVSSMVDIFISAIANEERPGVDA